MGDRIEVTDRGQRITMIEKAVPPNYRAEPNRKRITIASFGGGVILSVGLLLLLEILNQTVRRPSELVKVLGAPPFGTVGFISGGTSGTRWSANRLATLGLLAINIPLLVLVVHIYITPIGTLLGFAPKSPTASQAVQGAAAKKTE